MTLKAFVNDSSLTQEDKDLWFSVLEKTDETQMKIFEDFIASKEENLKLMTKNIKAKRKAFEMADQELLDSILQKENA